MVTKSKITIIPRRILLSFPMCSYFTVPTALIMAKPKKTKNMCLITCPVVVPFCTMYSRLELAEYTGNTEKKEIKIITIQSTLSPFKSSNLFSCCSILYFIGLKSYFISYRHFVALFNYFLKLLL